MWALRVMQLGKYPQLFQNFRGGPPPPPSKSASVYFNNSIMYSFSKTLVLSPFQIYRNKSVRVIHSWQITFTFIVTLYVSKRTFQEMSCSSVCCIECRKEFRLKNFGFNNVHPARFVLFQVKTELYRYNSFFQNGKIMYRYVIRHVSRYMYI